MQIHCFECQRVASPFPMHHHLRLTVVFGVVGDRATVKLCYSCYRRVNIACGKIIAHILRRRFVLKRKKDSPLAHPVVGWFEPPLSNEDRRILKKCRNWIQISAAQMQALPRVPVEMYRWNKDFGPPLTW